MLRYLLRLSLFLILPLTVFFVAVFRVDGHSDPYYLRFTTPRQSSLIIGTSEAAQGIHPQELDSVLKMGGRKVKFFNYGFSLLNSNYGPVYYESILKKLDPRTTHGVFILCVNPLGLSGIRGKSDAQNEQSDREHSVLARVGNVNINPNIEYLISAYDHPLLTSLLPKNGPQFVKTELHPDGWYEIRPDLSEEAVSKRIDQRKRELRDGRFSWSIPSAWRLAYLYMTIDRLKKHGTVILVRLPAFSGIRSMEDAYMPEFDALMELSAQDKGIRYFKIPPDDHEWNYVDGVHLTPASGAKASRLIGKELLKDMEASPY